MDQTISPEIQWADGYSMMPCFLTVEDKQFPAIGIDFTASVSGGVMPIVFVGDPEVLRAFADGVKTTIEASIEGMTMPPEEEVADVDVD